MSESKDSRRADWRDWLAWESSPFIGGFAYVALGAISGLRTFGAESRGSEVFAAVMIFWVIALPLTLAGYFALWVFRLRSFLSHLLAGFILGAGVFALSSPAPSIALNAVSGALTAATFYLIRNGGRKVAQQVRPDNVG